MATDSPLSPETAGPVAQQEKPAEMADRQDFLP
jgi:hypothetical protein